MSARLWATAAMAVTLSLAAPAVAGTTLSDVVVMSARLDKVEDGTTAGEAVKQSKLTLTPDGTLLGAWGGRGTVFWTEHAGEVPAQVGERYFLMIETTGDDSYVVVWRGPVAKGMCAPAATVAAYGATDVMQDLVTQYPCTGG